MCWWGPVSWAFLTGWCEGRPTQQWSHVTHLSPTLDALCVLRGFFASMRFAKGVLGPRAIRSLFWRIAQTGPARLPWMWCTDEDFVACAMAQGSEWALVQWMHGTLVGGSGRQTTDEDFPSPATVAILCSNFYSCSPGRAHDYVMPTLA